MPFNWADDAEELEALENAEKSRAQLAAEALASKKAAETLAAKLKLDDMERTRMVNMETLKQNIKRVTDESRIGSAMGKFAICDTPYNPRSTSTNTVSGGPTTVFEGGKVIRDSLVLPVEKFHDLRGRKTWRSGSEAPPVKTVSSARVSAETSKAMSEDYMGARHRGKPWNFRKDNSAQLKSSRTTWEPTSLGKSNTVKKEELQVLKPGQMIGARTSAPISLCDRPGREKQLVKTSGSMGLETSKTSPLALESFPVLSPAKTNLEQLFALKNAEQNKRMTSRGNKKNTSALVTKNANLPIRNASRAKYDEDEAFPPNLLEIK